MSNETSLKTPKAEGNIVILRPSKLAAEGTTGEVAKGVLEKIEKNKFDATKKDFFIRGADNTLYILNETKSLKDQLDNPALVGKTVRIEYKGKVKTKNGKGYHDFEAFLVS